MSDWIQFAIREIENAKRKLWEGELKEMQTIKHRLNNGYELTPRQEKKLLEIRNRVTEPSRIKW